VFLLSASKTLPHVRADAIVPPYRQSVDQMRWIQERWSEHSTYAERGKRKRRRKRQKLTERKGIKLGEREVEIWHNSILPTVKQERPLRIGSTNFSLSLDFSTFNFTVTHNIRYTQGESTTFTVHDERKEEVGRERVEVSVPRSTLPPSSPPLVADTFTSSGGEKNRQTVERANGLHIYSRSCCIASERANECVEFVCEWKRLSNSRKSNALTF